MTFTIGTVDELGLSGLKQTWVTSEQQGRELALTCGAGLGSPYLEGSVSGGGKPSLYARADVRHLAGDLWTELWLASRDQADGEEVA